jgi:hypothetical protein
MKVCQDWYDIVQHLSKFIIIRNKSDVLRLIKLFNEYDEAENAGNESGFSVSNSVIRLDIVLVPEDVIPLLSYLSNLKIVIIHTRYDSPSTLLCDALMNSCRSSLQYFYWSWAFSNRFGVPDCGLQKRFPSLLTLTTTSRYIPYGADKFTPFSFPAPNFALLSTACFQRWDRELLSNFQNHKGIDTCQTPLPSLKMLISRNYSDPAIFERLLQGFIGPSLTSVSIDDQHNHCRVRKEISLLSSFPHISHLLILLDYLNSFPYQSCLKWIELPDNIALLGLRCRRASNGRGGYKELVAAIKSMKAVGLREVQLYEWNVHDLRTNHAEVWEDLKDVVREKGWELSILDFGSLA